MVAFTLGVLGVLGVLGCTPRSHVAYRSATQEAQNEAIAARAAGKELANSKAVRVFIDETPYPLLEAADGADDRRVTAGLRGYQDQRHHRSPGFAL